MIKFWFLNLILIGFKAASGISNAMDFKKELFDLTNEISQKYFQEFRCVTIILSQEENLYYFDVSVPFFLINPSNLSGKLLRDDLFIKSFEEGCGGYMIQANADDRLTIFKNLLSGKAGTKTFRYNRQKYIFMASDENDTDATILLSSDMFFLPNCIFLSPKPKYEFTRTFLLLEHTLFDYHKNEVLHKKLEVVEEWTYGRGFKNNAILFKDKIQNIQGKKLIFSIIHYVPYSLVIEESDKTIYDGIETRIAKGFTNSINGTWDAVTHPKELWGTKFPNGSGTGIYGSIQRHAADIGYSAIYQWYCDVVDCSYPYIQATVTCLVPKPQMLSAWSTIFRPFSLSTWMGLASAYVITSLVFWGLTYRQKRFKGESTSEQAVSMAGQSFFQMFRVQFEQCPKIGFNNNLLGTYLKISTYYYFFVGVIWKGGIASILTTPRYEKPINDASELVSRWPSVQWGAAHDVWIETIKNTSDPTLHHIVDKFLILDKEELKKKSETSDFAYFLERLPTGHFGFNDYINEETVKRMQLMEHGIYNGFAVMLLPRGSPYTEKLNDFIHWSFSTGLIQKIETQVSLDRINNHLQNMIRYSDVKESGKIILALRHIQSSIYMYFIGIAVAAQVLLCEIFLFRKKFIKTNK